MASARCFNSGFIRLLRQADRCCGLCRYSFASSCETQLLGGRRLQRNLIETEVADFGNPLPHGLAIRAEAGLLAEKRRVDMIEQSAAVAYEAHRMGEKAIRGCAFPL